ncbi:MAG TPA: hypothetical protein VHM02_08795, partial [Thermoanaerobaculia bacterium]|nr:hypothetical protein [Thermoanaerobaculia bacterium]
MQHQPTGGSGEERPRLRLDEVAEVEPGTEEDRLRRRQQHAAAVDLLGDAQVRLPRPGGQGRHLDHRLVARRGRQPAVELRQRRGRGVGGRRPYEVDEVVVGEEGAGEEARVEEGAAQDEERHR